MSVGHDIAIDQGVAEDNAEFAERTAIRAYRAGRYILIVATGFLPTPGYEVSIEPSPLRIFPQQYNLLRRPLRGIWPQHVVPYTTAGVFGYPVDQSVVTVHHADGRDEVTIVDAGDDLAQFKSAVAGGRKGLPSEIESTGISSKLSFDEAFSDALKNLPPTTHPDQMTSVKVVEAGGLFGGIAGFHHLYVNIVATRD